MGNNNEIKTIKCRKNESIHLVHSPCYGNYSDVASNTEKRFRIIGNIGSISRLPWWGSTATVVGSVGTIYDIYSPHEYPDEIFVSEEIEKIGEIDSETFVCAGTIVNVGDFEVGYTTGYYNEKERVKNYGYKFTGSELFANFIGSAEIESVVNVIPKEYFDIELAIREAMDPEEIKEKCRSYKPKENRKVK